MFYQTSFGKEGNCQAACLASLFNISLESVIDLTKTDSDDEWNEMLNRWLLSIGYYRLCFNNNDLVPPGYYIGAVMSPRGLLHAVLCFKDEIVWDPHPDQDSYDKKLIEYELYVPINPKIG